MLYDRPAPEEMLTIAPPPRAFMWGTTARVKWNAPSRLIATIRRHASSLTCSTGCIVCPATPPAVLTRMSIRPAASATSPTNAPTRAASVTSTSAVWERPRPPVLAAGEDRRVADSTASRVPSRSSPSTSQAQICAPSPARATQIARPIPCAAPVTIATRSVNLEAMVVLPPVPLPPPPEPGIEQIAEAIPDQVEADHRDEDGQTGERRDPRRRQHERPARGEHRPPLRGGRARPESEERQACRLHDHEADRQRRHDDDRGEDIRKNVVAGETLAAAVGFAGHPRHRRIAATIVETAAR